MLVHVGLGVILKDRCADVRCTFNERKSVILHWLESFPNREQTVHLSMAMWWQSLAAVLNLSQTEVLRSCYSP